MASVTIATTAVAATMVTAHTHNNTSRDRSASLRACCWATCSKLIHRLCLVLQPSACDQELGIERGQFGHGGAAIGDRGTHHLVRLQRIRLGLIERALDLGAQFRRQCRFRQTVHGLVQSVAVVANTLARLERVEVVT